MQQKGFSVVLSDMCPLVSGISSKDAALSLELGMQALNLAVGGAALAHSNNEIQTEESNDGATTISDDNGVLRRGGNLVIKLLESEDVQGPFLNSFLVLPLCSGNIIAVIAPLKLCLDMFFYPSSGCLFCRNQQALQTAV